MGSGSSKAKKITAPQAHSSSSERKQPDVVANVNKLEPLSQPTTEKGINGDNYVSDILVNNTNSETGRTFLVNEKNNGKKEGKSKNNINSGRVEDTELVFQDDSDLDENIDEVLRIPVAVDNSRLNKGSDTKKRERKKDNSYLDREHESETDATKVFTDAQQVSLPETYVQRMQRKQYKFQHKLHLHDKEVDRDPKEWQQENEENKVIQDSRQIQFDATKFRAANRGMDPKKDLFTTESQDLGTIPSVQTSSQSFDDFEWTAKEDTLIIKQLPRYNQSELDLMKQLEDEAL